MANLVHVLEATLKGPRRSSQRPTNPRPHTDQGGTASAGDRTDFQPGTGRPTGGTETKGSQKDYFCDFGCVVSASGVAVTV
jgi:hypothetical protein